MMPSTLARIRWRILAFMFGFAFLSYLQRSSLSVAAGHIMPDLHLSKGQIGMLMWAFTVVYTLAQLPGGIIGQRYGARRVYCVVGLVGSVATVATPIAPMLLGGLGLFVVLLAAQSALGASQGPVFPAFAGVVANWFPKHQWSLAQGLQTAGMNIGAAVAPPLIVALERGFDWQGAMISVGLPGLLLAIAWLWYGRNRPDQHPAVSAAELGELGESRALHIQPLTVARLKAVLADRNVLLLTFSYLCMNYLFYLLQNYSFLYLTEERHFAGMQAGWPGNAAGGRRAAAAGELHRRALHGSGGADARLLLDRGDRGPLLGRHHVRGARGQHGRRGRAEHRRQPRGRCRHPDHHLVLGRRALDRGVRHRHRLCRGRGSGLAADRSGAPHRRRQVMRREAAAQRRSQGQ